MNDPILGYAIAGFVALAALSMVVQAIAAMKIQRSVRELREQVSPLIPRAEAALEAARETIAESRTQIRDISSRTIRVLESTTTQLARVEEVVLDATSRAKHQLERTEMVVEDTVTRLHETVGAVQGTILKPIREVNGLAAGLRAGISHLFRGANPSPAHATQDEELFI